MAPPSFGDLGKNANDLFSKDFTIGRVKVDVTTKTLSGIELKTNASHDTEKGRLSLDLESKYSIKEHGVTLTDKWKSSNVLATEVVVEDKLVQGLKNTLEVSFEPNSGRKGAKVKNSFKRANANAALDLDFKSSLPTLSASGVFGFGDYFAGASVCYDTERQKLTKLNYGLSYQLKDFQLYGGVENGTNFSGSVYQKVSSKLQTGVRFSWASNTHVTSFGIAAKYQLRAGSFAKVKVDNSSTIGAAYSFRVNDGVRATLCCSVDGKNINGGSHRLGAGFSFEQ